MSAVISECGKYRYFLEREITDIFGHLVSDKIMTFIMLNPSTADANIDDPTIRRCKAFAERSSCGRMYVVNLFAIRSPSPKVLQETSDPEGPDNYKWVKHAVEHDGPIVCAWGTHGAYLDQDKTMMGWLYHSFARDPFCLGLTKDGHPKHPLYLRKDSPLLPYRGRA